MISNDFSLKKMFFDLYRPISMRNFTGNPFLMVSERSGHAKLVKTSKNHFLVEIIDILETDAHLESRTTPNPTVVHGRILQKPVLAIDAGAARIPNVPRIISLIDSDEIRTVRGCTDSHGPRDIPKTQNTTMY